MLRIAAISTFFIIGLYSQSDIYFSPTFDVDAARTGMETISRTDLEAHLTFLASDVTEGRATGETGLAIAGEYIASHFRRVGLTPLLNNNSYFQRYELIKTKLSNKNQLTLLLDYGSSSLKENFQYEEDFFVSPRGLSGSIEIQAPVVYAGYGISSKEYNYNDYAGISVNNCIVLIIDGEPELDNPNRFNGSFDTRFSDLREKLDQAKKNGASAVLIATNPKSDELFPDKQKRWKKWLHRESMSLPTSDDIVPVITISETTADRILSGTGKTLRDLQIELESEGKSNGRSISNSYIRLNINLIKESIISNNIVGYLPGTDPFIGHETVVISAHYDHVGKNTKGEIYYGADDNASGTSALMEIAEAITKNTTPSKRGFLFLAVSGEEKGLLGSKHYVKKPLLPLSNTVADLNIDMIGRNAPDSVYIIGSNMISQDLHEINEYAANQIENLFLNYRFNSKNDPQRFYYRSDHYNFAQFGIPIIFYFAGVHEDYHKTTDTIEKINFQKLEKVSRLIYLTSWSVANNETKLRKNAGELPMLPDQIKH
ncbi:MAG: hypothetical protein CMG75_02815 [Candidatus Marinimicrobia bacterium]|nr:hypothetical protein [Candidatus Neomarinimicrobiota bacterium]|tara:strand:+ start:15891 stop:17519 length:1629 start_codon:yes stop_codon:yes gene_type:complete